MGTITRFKPSDNNEMEHIHPKHYSLSEANEQLLNLINGVAADLQVYNQKVAKITHQEHLLNK